MTSETGILLVYVTCADEAEAQRIAGALLAQKLIACANVFQPHMAVYMWENQVRHEPETLLLVKTHDRCFTALKEVVISLHSYDTPCIVAWPANAGHDPFLHWVRSSVIS